MTMGIREILTVLFVSLGLFFATVSVIGTIRQKDFLSYLQIAGVGSGAGILLCCSGLLIYEGFSLTGFKIVFIGLMLFLTGPVGTHAIAKAAFHRENFVEKNVQEDFLKKRPRTEVRNEKKEEEHVCIDCGSSAAGAIDRYQRGHHRGPEADVLCDHLLRVQFRGDALIYDRRCSGRRLYRGGDRDGFDRLLCDSYQIHTKKARDR